MLRRSNVRGRGRGASGAPFNPLTEDVLFREVTVDAGAGACSQWTDLRPGLKHATQSIAGNRPTIVTSDSAFGGAPSVSYTTDDYLTAGGTTAYWKFVHDTTSATIWGVVYPTGAKNDQILWYGIGDLTAASTGHTVLYHGTRQTFEVFCGNGGASRLVALMGADGECPINAAHIVVYRKNALGWELWVNRALIMSGEWNGVPSSAAGSLVPSFGSTVSYAATRQFEGRMAEIGYSTKYLDPIAIDAYARARYGITTRRTPTHRMLFKDGVNVGSGISADGARVWSYFTLASSTPGATQVACTAISRGTILSVQTRTNGQPFPIVAGGINDRRQVIIALNLTATPGWIADGRSIRAILWLGESGASGRSTGGTLPVGYPPGNGSPYQCDNEMQVAPIVEFIDRVQTYPVDAQLNAESGTVGYGYSGMAAWNLAVRDSNHCWLLLNCGKGSQTSTNWLSATSRGTCFGAAVARVLAMDEIALAYGRTIEWTGVVLDQGINDAVTTPTPWDTNWTATKAAWITALPNFSGKTWRYRRMPTIVAVGSELGWADLLVDQDAWAAADRVKLTYEPAAYPTGFQEAGNIHLNTASNVAFATIVSDSVATELGL